MACVRGWRRPGLLAVLALLFVAGAACSGSGYQYVSNRDSGTYFKLPADWATFDVSTDRPEAIAPLPPWQVIFDANPQPSRDHLGDDSPDYPVGFAQVVPVQQRDSVSLASLRALALGGQADPLQLIQDGSENIELVTYGDVVNDGGYHGNRMILNLKQSDGNFVTLAQIAMVDPSTSSIYRLLLTCTSECFDLNRTEINRVMDSWTIEPKD